MTTQQVYIVPDRRISKSSLASLICGVLGCVPFLMGLLAVVFGFIGIMRTGNPAKSGRWMAVVGLILGLVSLVAWSGVGVMGGGVWAIFKVTEGPRVASHDFLRDVSAGNDAAAKAATTGISDDAYDALAKTIREDGSFIDSTFTSTNLNNDTAHVEGNASFSKTGGNVTVDVTADLKSVGGKWKVKSMTVSP